MSSADGERGAPPIVAGHTLLCITYAFGVYASQLELSKWVFVMYHLEPQWGCYISPYSIPCLPALNVPRTSPGQLGGLLMGTGFTRPAPKHRKSEGVTQNIVACVVYILASERERPTVSTSGNALAFMGERIEPDS